MNNESISNIQRVIDSGSPVWLETLYAAADKSPVLDRLLITQLWYKAQPLEDCTEKQLEGLAQAITFGPHSIAKDAYLEYAKENCPTAYVARLKKLFAAAIQLEDEYGHLETATQDTLTAILEYLELNTCEAVRLYANTIITYGKWLMDSGYPFGQMLCALRPRHILIATSLKPGMKAKCVADPAMLNAMIRSCYSIDTGNKGPVAIVLAWMGFQLKEIIEIRDDEVDAEAHTIRGKKVPDELWEIVRMYLWVTVEQGFYDSVEDNRNRTRTFRFTQNGMLMKMTRAGKVNANSVQARIAEFSTNITNVMLSGQYYKLWQMERKGKLTEQSIVEALNISVSPAVYKKRMGDILREYAAYKSVFHGNGT